ncbi:MAG: N-acetylglucosamine-6-phosphate deacetylase [Actinomycetota bacterium]
MSGLESRSQNVDLHCHGGAGYYFSDPNPDNVKTAIEFHKSHGTSTLVASLVTEEIPVLKEQIQRLLPFSQDKSIAGIHLEGPYLAQARCGAHEPSLLKAPKLDEIKSLLDTGQGHISMITIAPELEGAIEAISYLRSQGVIAAIGHSAGNYDDAIRAIDAGAQLVTHFSNGMSKLADGDKTFATALLFESDILLELILDGHHVSDNDVHTIFSHAGDRVVFVTDAMAAAGQPDGEYRIGNLDVNVKDGVARLKKNGSLAGSTLTMDLAITNARALGLSDEIIYESSSKNARDLLG